MLFIVTILESSVMITSELKKRFSNGLLYLQFSFFEIEGKNYWTLNIVEYRNTAVS